MNMSADDIESKDDFAFWLPLGGPIDIEMEALDVEVLKFIIEGDSVEKVDPTLDTIADEVEQVNLHSDNIVPPKLTPYEKEK